MPVICALFMRSPPLRKVLSWFEVYSACWPARRGHWAGMPAPLGEWQPAQAGDLAICDAAAVDALAQCHQLLVLSRAVGGLLAREPERDVRMSSSLRVAAMPDITALARLPDLNSVSCLTRYSGC